MATPESGIWEAPVNTEGVLEAADQPASPGEQVADAPATAAPAQQAQPEPKTEDATEAANALDWRTAPEKFRQAHEAEKPLREFAKQYGGADKLREYVEPLRELEREVGGVEQLREAVEFDNLMRNPAVPVEQKIERLHALSETEFDRVGGALVRRVWALPEWQDELLASRFGATAERIEQALKGGAQPQTQAEPPFDPVAYAREVLADPLANEFDKGLARYTIAQAEEAASRAEALAKLPTLEKEVGDLRQQITTGSEAEVAVKREALTDEFLRDAFAPVNDIISQAFPAIPGETPEDAQRREYAANSVRRDVFAELYPLHDPAHPNHALAKEVEGYLQNLDRANAYRKIPKINALAEMAAQKYASYLSATYSQKRQVQSEPLKREPNPPVVNGQGASFGNTDPLPPGREVWNDPNIGTRWQEIADS